MPPRWIKTKDHKPTLYGPNYDENDWLMLSGRFVVGRVGPAGGSPVKGRFDWSLTGPHTPEAPVRIGGTADDIEGAKAALLSSWRRWQEWAELQDRDASPSVKHIDNL